MADNICPKCGKRNKAGAMFCGGCGAPIPGAQDQGSANKTLFMGSGVAPPQVPMPQAPAPQAPAPQAPAQPAYTPPASGQPAYMPPAPAPQAPAPQAPGQPAYTPPAPGQPAYTPPAPAQPAYAPPTSAAPAPGSTPPLAGPPPGAAPARQINSMPKGPPSRARPVAGPMGGGPPAARPPAPAPASAPAPAPAPGAPPVQPGHGMLETIAAGAPGAPPPISQPGLTPGASAVAAPPVVAPPAAAPLAAGSPAAPPPTVSPLSGVHAPPMAAPPPGAAPAPGGYSGATGAPPAAVGAPPGPDDSDLVGKTLNRRYLVEAHIGEGGFGDVYRAKQIQMDREVAIKVLAPGMSQDENLVARFRREAKSACNLRDPHTIITYDFDETENGLLYIAMELLQGETLFDVMEEDTLVPAARVAGILEQSCTSLGEAHSVGIVHRDIKPENIFLEHRPDYPDFVKVLDFGIAKIIAGDLAQGPQLTAAGQTLGTLEYMSPEQLMGKKLDGRSDIYALGMMAYQMLTGTLPFASNSPASIIQWHLKKLPQPASTLVPTVPADFDPIILKMIAKDRDARYSSVSELREDLRQMMSRQGWLVGGGSGPMTAIPQAPLPGAQAQPAPVMGSRPAGPGNAAAALMPSGGVAPKKSNLPLIIVVALVILGLVGFALWFFVVRGGSDGSKSSSGSKAKKGMTVAEDAVGRPTAMRLAMRPAAMRLAAMRPTAERPAAMGPPAMRAVARKPSLGGLLGILGGRSSGPGGTTRPAGGLGGLVGVGQRLPAPGKIARGRRSRAGVRASEKDPLRVIPPEMTIWGQVDLNGLRKTRWGRKLLAKIPPKAVQTLVSMGLSPAKIGTVAMGMNFKQVSGGKEEPIMLFAVSGNLKTKALLRALKEEKGKIVETRVAGYKVAQKGDLNLVLPSNKLVLFSSKELVRNGLARMSSKRVKSAVEGGWGRALLKALGVGSTPDVMIAMALPPALQKQTTTVLAQLKAGPGAALLNFMVYGVVSGRGLALTLAATCSSGAVATKLRMMLPIMVKLLAAKVPGPIKSLIAGLRFEARGAVLALRLDLSEAQVGLLTTMVMAAAE